MEISWRLQTFDQISVEDLYTMLRLRSRVFVVEQNCVFLDQDNLDQQCLHLCGYQAQALVAYSRLVPIGVAYPEYASIGRVVTAPEARAGGLGRALMLKSIEELYTQFGTQYIKIGAQAYLTRFYQSLGFEQSGPQYLEDGILHMPMIKPAIAIPTLLDSL